MTKIDERKNIIISLKSNYRNEIKGIDKQIRNLSIMSFMNIFLSLICGGMILISIISEQFGFEILKWEKSAVLVILSITVFLSFPYDIYELKLLRHLKIINNYKDFTELEKLNIELKNIIVRLNNRKKSSTFLIVFIILILVMGLWQFSLENNPYWNYMKFPIILFFGFTLTRFIQGFKNLEENIKKVESTVANNS
ncbi:MAG: hypothetical protein COZ17_13930 [Flavobacteriaceae bacterium CG_4_10_14_3_um_filter_33_47]|nr:MAG: hypothetical protein COZ17_13930 [Flavobacteriaceae bacterium CG_4_10_14_3_um_filter_33_47]